MNASVAPVHCFNSTVEAAGALDSIGATHDSRLILDVDDPVIGPIKRIFGIMGNVYRDAEPADPAVFHRFRQCLAGRQEDAIAPCSPVDELVLHTLEPMLHARGLHLPWTFRPMNLDLARRLTDVNLLQRFPFRVVYSRVVDIRQGAGGPMVYLRGLFSLPLDGSAQRTFPDTPVGSLPPGTALVVEANCR